MRHIFIYCICFATLTTIELQSQNLPLQLENEFTLKSFWEEYTADLYNIGDSLIYTIGLSTLKDGGDTYQNVFIRSFDLEGSILLEEHVPVIKDTVPFGGYALETYYGASCFDGKFFYVITVGDRHDCYPDSTKRRAIRILKFNLDGELLKSSLHCSQYYLSYEDIIKHPQKDSIYMSAYIYTIDWKPYKIISRMHSSLESDIQHQLINTKETSLEDLRFQDDTLFVRGSHYAKNESSSVFPNIWWGYIDGDSINIQKKFSYFNRFVFKESFQLEDNEIAIRGSQQWTSAHHESIFLFRNDTLAFNIYDSYFIELADFMKLDSTYILFTASYREPDTTGIVSMRLLDWEGYTYDKSINYHIPWIQYYNEGIKVGDYYIVAIKISNYRIQEEVIKGNIDPETTSSEYTHFLKFKIE